MATKAHTPIPPPPHPTYDLRQVVKQALHEDAGGLGDVTTLATIPESAQAVATFLAKDDGVLAGLGVADMVFEEVDPTLQVAWTAKDGDELKKGQEFGTVRGSARSILVAERVALNFMQRMSGTATATRAYVKRAAEGGPTKILETRKTVPGLRLLDKWAVLIGGGQNHRMGLYDMMLIKDNHIAAAGGITAAIKRAEEYIAAQGLKDMKIEIETESLKEVDEVLALIESGTAPHLTRIMLDNMARPDASCLDGIDVSLLKQAVEKIAGRVETEGSGNVTLDRVKAFSTSGVTYVSIGALTHSVKAFDISLNIKL